MTLIGGRKYVKYLFAAVFAFIILSTGSLSVLTGNQATDFSAVSTAHAQEAETTYEFMQPIDGIPILGGGEGENEGQIDASDQSFADFIDTLIQIAIGFAILLSIIMVIAGGIEYMTARGSSGKTEAKERIGKAIGGMLLALSAVVILQTINPNLVELDPFDEVSVEGEDISVGTGGTANPEESGMYYCFEADTTTGGLTAPDTNICSETISECQNVKNNGGYDVTRDSCRLEVYYNNAYTYFTGVNDGSTELNESSDYCVGYRYGGQDSVKCFEQEQTCQNSSLSGERKTQCRTPDDAGNFVESGGTQFTYQSTGTLVIDNDAPADGTEISSATGTGEDSVDYIAEQQAKSDCESKLLDVADQNDNICNDAPDGLFNCRINGCDSAQQVSDGGGSDATVFSCPRGSDDSDDQCEPAERLSCENCQTLESFGLDEHFRPDPRVCHEDYALLPDQCKVNNSLAGKLQDLKSNLDFPWTLNEVWPPTIRHQSTCHAKGTCVDIALRQDTNSDGDPINPYPNNTDPTIIQEHANRVNEFFNVADSAGLSVTYEVGSDQLENELQTRTGLADDKIKNFGLAPHFSVYRLPSDR